MVLSFNVCQYIFAVLHAWDLVYVSMAMLQITWDLVIALTSLVLITIRMRIIAQLIDLCDKQA